MFDLRAHMLHEHGWGLDSEGFDTMSDEALVVSHNEDHADLDNSFHHHHEESHV